MYQKKKKYSLFSNKWQLYLCPFDKSQTIFRKALKPRVVTNAKLVIFIFLIFYRMTVYRRVSIAFQGVRRLDLTVI